MAGKEFNIINIFNKTNMTSCTIYYDGAPALHFFR